MKMYRVSKWDESEIKEFEVTKTTDKCVFYVQMWHGGHSNTQRELYDSSYHRWFKTKNEAFDFAIEREQDRAADCHAVGNLLGEVDRENGPW